MIDDSAVVLEETCFLWIVVVVSWIMYCGRCGLVPMNCQCVGFDSESSYSRGTLVVVSILASRRAGSCCVGFVVATHRGEYLSVVVVNCFFSMAGVRIHDYDVGTESAH